MFIFVQFMHCLIYMKRGGKMEQETEKKSNRKIHIIFAIFTLILSFGISIIDVNANYDVNLDNGEKYTYSDYLSYKQVCTATSCKGRYSIYYAYFNSTDISVTKFDKFYSLNLVSSSDLNDKNKILFYRVQYSGKDEIEDVVYYTSDLPSIFFEDVSNNGIAEDFITSSQALYEAFNQLTGGTFVPEYIPPKGVMEKSLSPLPEMILTETQVIIGGTICLLALIIFLGILVRHFRAVSQGY